MSQRLASLLFLLVPCYVCAQGLPLQPGRVHGHAIGESVAELLSKEPEVQQQVNACRQHPHAGTCDRLMAGITRGQRAQVSTSNWSTFVVDGGKLVKLQTLLHGTAEAAKNDLTQKFGLPSSETPFPMQNAMGTKWEDHLFVWDTPVVYVGLHEDNNPASQNHHLVLVVESRAEHDLEHADEMSPPSAGKY